MASLWTSSAPSVADKLLSSSQKNQEFPPVLCLYSIFLHSFVFPKDQSTFAFFFLKCFVKESVELRWKLMLMMNRILSALPQPGFVFVSSELHSQLAAAQINDPVWCQGNTETKHTGIRDVNTGDIRDTVVFQWGILKSIMCPMTSPPSFGSYFH